ncbi:hypothetical protein PRIPAC_79629 [Pristionchus pacificus]|uniref:Uncharacterized protein n=1 Tax=Pristionchus pacificus TaxID=54126 RepID=A0A2A6BW37_PRIPA|nr:hypothetical protein PRIPAC_79629 [Pristionchus pacificus]|eukprot:PDM70077.1 hypothetical protein PRIPAC_49289 [Pristionchus pacificus]
MPSHCPSSSSTTSRLLRSTSKTTTSSIKKLSSSKTPRLFPSIPSLLGKLPGLPSLLARIPGLGKTTKEESPRLYPRMFSLLDSRPLEPILEIDVDAPPTSPGSPPPSPADTRLDEPDSTVRLNAPARPSTPESPASLSPDEDSNGEDDEDTIDDSLPFTPVNVRDVSDSIFSATFTQQIANQWEELEELRKQKRTAKTVRETRHEERLFTIARGHNAYALVVPFGDKPMKAPLHEELRFPPTDEQLAVIHRALGRAYQGKFADSLMELKSFERTLHHLQFGGGNARRSLLETHAYLRAHVPSYGKRRKRTDLEDTLSIVRKLRPIPPASPESDESQSDDSSTDAPWEVQEFRRRSRKKTAAAQIDGSTPWAAPQRRGLRPITLRMKEEEKEETGNTKRRPAKRRKLSFK